MEVSVTGLLRYPSAEVASSELASLREAVTDVCLNSVTLAGTDLSFETLRYEGPSPQELPLAGWSRLRAAIEVTARFAVGGSLRWWTGGQEHVIQAESDLPAFASFPAELRRLLRHVVGEDFDSVECARDLLDPADLPGLAAAFPHLEHDLQKAALVLLTCDTIHPAMEGVMREALRLPVVDTHDLFDIARATALSHLKGDLQAHDWQPRAELEAAIQAYLAEGGGSEPS